MRCFRHTGWSVKVNQISFWPSVVMLLLTGDSCPQRFNNGANPYVEDDAISIQPIIGVVLLLTTVVNVILLFPIWLVDSSHLNASSEENSVLKLCVFSFNDLYDRLSSWLMIDMFAGSIVAWPVGAPGQPGGTREQVHFVLVVHDGCIDKFQR